MNKEIKNRALNLGLLTMLMIFLFLPGVFAEEPSQESVDIVEFIDCPFYNVWCKFKKSTLQSAYEYQESNYHVINESLSGASLIQVTEFDSFHKDMHHFGMRLLRIYYMLWGTVIVVLLISSFASPIRQMIAQDYLKRFAIGATLTVVTPIAIVLLNNFFFQFIKLFLMDVNITNLILYPYSLDQGVVKFWFISFLADKVLMLIGAYALLYKALLYLSPLLVLFVVALWYTPHKPELLKNLLLVAYAYIPIMVICMNVFSSILSHTSMGYMALPMSLFSIFLIFTFLNSYIILNSLIKKLVKPLTDTIRESVMKRAAENKRLKQDHERKQHEMRLEHEQNIKHLEEQINYHKDEHTRLHKEHEQLKSSMFHESRHEFEGESTFSKIKSKTKSAYHGTKTKIKTSFSKFRRK